MPKPSEIFDTPEAISRVGGNENWEDDFRKQFDELKLKPPKNSMKNAERELIIWYFRNLLTTKDKEKEEAVRAERERINQYFAAKADYDTDNDCVIITDKIYHRAFFPDGCGSDGKEGRNRCEDCYKYRTKFGQNVLAKLEPALPTEDNK